MYSTVRLFRHLLYNVEALLAICAAGFNLAKIVNRHAISCSLRLTGCASEQISSYITCSCLEFEERLHISNQQLMYCGIDVCLCR